MRKVKLETARTRAAVSAHTNDVIASARQRELAAKLAAQSCPDYLFSKINRNCQERRSAATVVHPAVTETTDVPKVVKKATDTMRALSVLAALAAISVIVCMNALWFM